MRSAIVAAVWIGVAGAASAADFHDLVHSGSTYVVARSDGAVERSGQGGVVYTTQATGGATALRGVGTLAGFFVAVGDGGRIVRSSNGGLSWSDENSRTPADLERITAHGSLYLVAVGAGGTTLRRVQTSADWDTTASPGSARLRDVASNGSILVAVGDGGTVLRSTDQGLSWQRQLLAGGPALRSVASRAGSTIFVAVGAGGRIVRSTNSGLDWESVASPTASDLNDVVQDANRFVAVGTAGTILRSSSTSGASGTWTDVGARLPGDLLGVWYDGTRFHAVGTGGVIARSFDGTAWIEVAIQPLDWGDVKGLYRPSAPRP